MARQRVVTRTINITKCEITCVDITAEEVVKNTITVSGVHKDEKALVKAIEATLDKGLKLVSVGSTEVEQVKYGMTEQDFINNATRIDD